MRKYRHLDVKLLKNIKENLTELKDLYSDINSEWLYEDYYYRWLHHSFKVYYAQESTNKIINVFLKISPSPEIELNKMFMDVVNNGINIKFDRSHNEEWYKYTLPILQAFDFCKYMLKMLIKYGEELETPPEMLPSGYASILYLYNMR